MKRAPYVPRRGDAVWVTMSSQAGRESTGRRPAVVVSPVAYNRRVGLALLCPITSQVKGYPFEAQIPVGLRVAGVVLSDQVKCIDWRARKATFICKLPGALVDEIRKKLNALLV